MSVEAYFLTYDIPENSGIPNPSRRLRRLAVRVNLSVWVIPKHSIPYNYLNGMMERGAVVHLVKFDDTEGGRLVAMAVDAIRRDIRTSLDRARGSSHRLNTRLDGSAEGAEAVAQHKRFRRDTAQVVSRLRRMLKDFEAVAERFGITRDQIGLGAAVAATQAIGAGFKTRARVYAQGIRELEAYAGADDGMVRAMKADAVPHAIAADYLEDRELYTSAQTIRSFAMDEFGFEL